MLYSDVPVDDGESYGHEETRFERFKNNTKLVWTHHKTAIFIFCLINIILLTTIIILSHVKISDNNTNNDNNNNNDNSNIFNIQVNKITIPQEENVYICEGFTIPKIQKEEGGIIKISPAIDNNQLALSVRLFTCDKELPPGPFQCYEPPTQMCKNILYSWAAGGSDIVLPSSTSFVLSTSFVMLEVQYKNPEMIDNVIDSSGVKGEIVRGTQSQTASFLDVSIPYSQISIPANQSSFEVNSTYLVELKTEIKAIGSISSMHVAGIATRTELLRNGDTIVTRCFYNTEGRLHETIGGLEISQEVCSSHILYYS